MNFYIPNRELYGKEITVSGWGYTEIYLESDELRFTVQRMFKIDPKINDIKEGRADERHNFMGDQIMYNGPCSGDSGGMICKFTLNEIRK